MDRRVIICFSLAACVLLAVVWWAGSGSQGKTSLQAPANNDVAGTSSGDGALSKSGSARIHPEEQWVVEYASKIRSHDVAIRNDQLKPLMQRAREHHLPAVRALAVTSLGSIGQVEPSAEKERMKVIFDAMEDPSLAVRQRAVSALRKGKGLTFPYYRADASEPKRKLAMRRVRQWMGRPAEGD